MYSGEIRDESNTQQVKMIDFFGIKISLNAYIILMAGLIMCIIMMFIGPYGPLIGIIAFLFVILAAYNVNCTLVGHCRVWAWFLTVFYIIYSIIVILSLYMKFKNGGGGEKEYSIIPQSIKKSIKKSTTSKQ